MDYWVDGYNLILRKRWDGSMTLEQARERLLAAAVGLGAGVRVYFDAAGQSAGGGSHDTRSSRVQAVFVREGSADDAMIQDLRGAARGTVTVVTDDRELRGRARQLGANTLRIDRFLQKLDRPGEPTPRRPGQQKARSSRQRGGGLSQTEVEDWMRWFGFEGDDPETGDPLP